MTEYVNGFKISKEFENLSKNGNDPVNVLPMQNEIGLIVISPIHNKSGYSKREYFNGKRGSQK